MNTANVELLSASRSAAIPLMRQVGVTDDRQLIALFLESRRKHSVTTAALYRFELERFMAAYAGSQIAGFTYPMLAAYTARFADKAPATEARITTIIRAFFRFAHKLGYLQVNPAELLEAPRVESSSAYRYINRDKCRRLAEAAMSQRDRTIILMFLYLGLRVSELAAVRTNAFYRDVKGSLGLRVTGKGNRVRRVKVPDVLWREIQGLHPFEVDASATESRHLFASRKGGRPLTVRRIQGIVSAAAERAGIGAISPHWLRHTSATLSILGGASLEQVKEQLGHGSITTTQIYLHSVHELQTAASDFIRFLEAEFNGARNDAPAQSAKP